jgi:hypothetical protein
VVEHFLGKEEVVSSILINGSDVSDTKRACDILMISEKKVQGGDAIPPEAGLNRSSVAGNINLKFVKTT